LGELLTPIAREHGVQRKGSSKASDAALVTGQRSALIQACIWTPGGLENGAADGGRPAGEARGALPARVCGAILGDGAILLGEGLTLSGARALAPYIRACTTVSELRFVVDMQKHLSPVKSTVLWWTGSAEDSEIDIHFDDESFASIDEAVAEAIAATNSTVRGSTRSILRRQRMFTGCGCLVGNRALLELKPRPCYGWTGHISGSGFSDLAPSILHYNWF
jgi:hypothetical protein